MAQATQIIIAENWEFMKVVSVPEDQRTAGIGTTAIVSVCPLPLFVNPSMDCGLTTAQIAAKDVPAGVKYEIIDKDKYDEYLYVGIGSTALTLTGAITSYDFDTKQCTYDLARAKKIAHRKRRNRRYNQFAPHDNVISKAIPGTATDAAEASRVGIRATYNTMQTEIDACSTVDEVYAILQKYPRQDVPPEALPSGYDTTEIGVNIPL
tara:strand:- start:1601 stop:2224 length:624 start_codon:yes stop_codon:yes gene_type:complete